MTYEEFQRQLGKAGLEARELAALLQMRPNSLTNYASLGRVPSHLAVIASLLGEMADRKVEFRGLLTSLDIERKKPRGAAYPGKFGGDRQEDLFPPPGWGKAKAVSGP